jgi:hypothetical protein
MDQSGIPKRETVFHTPLPHVHWAPAWDLGDGFVDGSWDENGGILLPEPVTLQGGGLHEEEASAWPLGTKFVIPSQKRILTHRCRDQEVY